MSFGEVGRYHQFIVTECGLYFGEIRFFRKGVTEDTEEVRGDPKKTRVDGHRVNAQVDAVATLIVRKTVLRKGDGLYTGTMTQPVRKPE